MTCADVQLCVRVDIPTSVWRFPGIWKKGLSYRIKRQVRSFLFNTLDEDRAYKLLKVLNRKHKEYVKKRVLDKQNEERIVREKELNIAREKVQKEEYLIKEIELQKLEEQKSKLVNNSVVEESIRKRKFAAFIESEQRQLAASTLLRSKEKESSVTEVDFFPSFSSYVPSHLKTPTLSEIMCQCKDAALKAKRRLNLPNHVYSESFFDKALSGLKMKYDDEKFRYRGEGLWVSPTTTLYYRPSEDELYQDRSLVSDLSRYSSQAVSQQLLPQKVVFANSEESSFEDLSPADVCRSSFCVEDESSTNSQLLESSEEIFENECSYLVPENAHNKQSAPLIVTTSSILTPEEISLEDSVYLAETCSESSSSSSESFDSEYSDAGSDSESEIETMSCS